MLPLALVVVVGLLLPGLSAGLQAIGLGAGAGASESKRLMTYEFVLAALALVIALATCHWAEGTSPGPFSIGSLDVPAARVRWLGLGLSPSATWRHEILSLGLVMTAVTAVFVYLGVRQDFRWSAAWANAPAILLFAALNATGEEWIYRVALLRAAERVVEPETASILSAVIFGVAHLGGTPGGLGGSIAAGILGYVLSRVTLDSGGIAAAWAVHLVQDVVIFTGLLGASGRTNS